MAGQKQVIVVGAGIIGASIAWHLAKAGARVTVVDAGEGGGVATPASFAWINASWGNPEPYFRLRTRSMREWARLAGEVPGIPLVWSGGLLWDQPRGDLEAYAAEHRLWGYGIRAVDRDAAARIEPALKNPPDFALHVAEEGVVEPAMAAQALLADAVRLGVEVRTGLAVKGLERHGGYVSVVTRESRIDADEVVLAAGVATPALAATLGIEVPLETPPGMIVHSKPYPALLNGLVLAPEMAVRQTAEGRIIGSGEFGGTDPGDDPSETARRLFAAMRSMLRNAEALALDFHTIGHRPMPRDGFPIVGGAGEGIYLAVMHSGITLAPAVGLFAAAEILTGVRDPLLDPYGVTRSG